MKKTLRIMLALALVIAALSVSVSAATDGFYNIDTTVENVAITAYNGTDTTAITATEVDVDADDSADAYYENSDRLGVTYSAATAGKNYGVILVAGDTLPTASSDIYYINQVQADGETVAFDVYPSDFAETEATMTLYISSDVEGANLVSVPMAYKVGYEEVVEPEEPEVTVNYGDADLSGGLGLNDVIVTLKIYTESYADPTEEQLVNADVDGVTGVTLNDAIMILKKYTGSLETFPVEQ